MNILVTGANGQLGCEMRMAAEVGANKDDKYFFTSRSPLSEDTKKQLKKIIPCDISCDILDITDIKEIRKYVAGKKIDVIVNCAAYTNVNKAESDKENAEKLNWHAPINLAITAKEFNATLIHISTDYVFNGNKRNTPWSESETPGKPQNIYGKSKFYGEVGICAVGCKYIIIRTSWLYSEIGNNFVKTVLKLAESGKECKFVFDQVGSPTYAADLAMFIVTIISNRKFKTNNGIYHYSDEGVCSWYDFAVYIANRYKHKAEGFSIKPCRTDDFPQPVTRPPYSVMDKAKVKKDFDAKIPYWTESVDACLSILFENLGY